MGSDYLDNFDETRKNFQANETTNLETYLAENPEIEFFRTLLANFKEQQVKTKNITEFFTIGIFKLNFIGMKKKALPAISKCIDKLYTILPKLARKKMDKILKECHANKTRWRYESSIFDPICPFSDLTLNQRLLRILSTTLIFSTPSKTQSQT